jgi:hypothetical protein
MPNIPTDAPRRRPTRRTVLKTGAHAAWAVPAIQIAAAAPAFAAASETSVLSVSSATTPADQTADGVLTLPAVTVRSTVADATGVSLLTSGSATAPNVTITGDVTSSGVTKTGLKVNLNEAGDGVVHLSAIGTTKGNGKVATQGAAATVYARSVLSIQDVSYVRKANNTGSVIVTLRAKYAPAKDVKVRVTNFIGGNPDRGSASSSSVNLPVGTDVVVTIPITQLTTNRVGNASVTITQGTTDNASATPLAAILPAAASTVDIGTTPNPVAALTITNEVDSRNFFGAGSTVTMRFRINSTHPVTGINWKVTSTNGTTLYKSGTSATGITTTNGYVDVPDFTFTMSSYSQVKITATATTVASGVAATPGTLTVATVG